MSPIDPAPMRGSNSDETDRRRGRGGERIGGGGWRGGGTHLCPEDPKKSEILKKGRKFSEDHGQKGKKTTNLIVGISSC